MPKVSSITVEYGRSIQPAPYENANAKVGFTVSFDPDDENINVDEAIAEAHDTARRHVHGILGLEERPAVVKSKPRVEASDTAAARAKAKAKPEKEAPAEDDIPSAAAEKEEVAPTATKGDILKAIGEAKKRLTASGVADTTGAFERIMEAYGVSKPYTYNKIDPSQWGDFVKDLNELGR